MFLLAYFPTIFLHWKSKMKRLTLWMFNLIKIPSEGQTVWFWCGVCWKDKHANAVKHPKKYTHPKHTPLTTHLQVKPIIRKYYYLMWSYCWTRRSEFHSFSAVVWYAFIVLATASLVCVGFILNENVLKYNFIWANETSLECLVEDTHKW